MLGREARLLCAGARPAARYRSLSTYQIIINATLHAVRTSHHPHVHASLPGIQLRRPTSSHAGLTCTETSVAR